MTIKAYQIDPCYQESPLMVDARCGSMEAYEGIIFSEIETGNDDEELYNRVCEVYDELCEYYENGEKASVLLNEYFPNPSGKAWSTKKVHEFIEILEKQDTRSYYEGNTNIELFNLVNNSDYRRRTLRGCSQGDWTDILYDPEKWSDADIEDIEAQYFNMGSEYKIDDVYGYYCTAWNEDGTRQELANMIGCEPGEIEIYQFDGYDQIPRYKAV